MSSANIETRTVSMIVATETPALQYVPDPTKTGADCREYVPALEILSIEPGAIDFSRSVGMPFVDSHDTYSSIERALGTVANLRIEGRALVAEALFRRRYAELVQDIADGHLQQVSVGYQVFEYEMVGLDEATDRRRDPLPDNAMLWAELLVAKHRMLRDDPEDYRSAHREHEALLMSGMSDDVEFVYRGTSSKVNGVEHSIHFHKGVNGSPGRASQFKALGYPIVGGHPHSPSIDDGVVSVGTCSDLRERWDPDATTKAHGHAIQYSNGHVVLCLMHPDGQYEPSGIRCFSAVDA